jgi:hypothetical protein
MSVKWIYVVENFEKDDDGEIIWVETPFRKVVWAKHFFAKEMEQWGSTCLSSPPKITLRRLVMSENEVDWTPGDYDLYETAENNWFNGDGDGVVIGTISSIE